MICENCGAEQRYGYRLCNLCELKWAAANPRKPITEADVNAAREEGAKAERERIVAWLDEQTDVHVAWLAAQTTVSTDVGWVYQSIRDAVERGEHLKEKP